jgi:hypothetical protein
MASITFDRFTAPRFPVEVLEEDKVLSYLSCCGASMTSPLPYEQKVLQPLIHCWFRHEDSQRQWPRRSCLNGWAEDQFLTLNLLFTIVYGGATAVGLWWVWRTAGCPFHPAWIIAPFAVIMTTDWTDHLIQLLQFRHCVSSNGERFETLVIQISSYATVIKTWLTLGLYVSLVGLTVKGFVRFWNRGLEVDAVV